MGSFVADAAIKQIKRLKEYGIPEEWPGTL